jgi:hypothetical protein
MAQARVAKVLDIIRLRPDLEADDDDVRIGLRTRITQRCRRVRRQAFVRVDDQDPIGIGRLQGG